jgi:LL-diaminopimelate aminotransferase
MPPTAARLGALPPYPFVAINQRIRELTVEGIDVIKLDVGSPDMPPPPAVVEALTASARRVDRHGYAGYKGTTAFREAVAQYYQRRFGVFVDPETQVLPLIGSKEGIVNLSLAYLDHTSVALVPEIAYPPYFMGAYLAGSTVYWLPAPPPHFIPQLDAIPEPILKRARLLWVNYPNNPTGATISQEAYQQLVEFCWEHDILLASDNPYVDVTFDDYRAPSALQAAGALDRVIEFISFSKTYNMAGWRLGAAVGAPGAIAALLQVKSNVDSGHFHAVYEAGIAAIASTDDEWLARRNVIYANRRDRILDALPSIGLCAEKPSGSMYVWARVEREDWNGAAYSEHALSEAHVSLAPGAMYGPGGDRYLRFSLGVPDARLDAALERLKLWYANY